MPDPHHPQAEAWLLHRLEQLHCPVPLAGALQDRLRAAITTEGYEHVIAGRAPNGKPETLEQAFERIFGEPLIARKGRVA